VFCNVKTKYQKIYRENAMNVLCNKFKPINDYRHLQFLPKRITLLSLMILELIIGNNYPRDLQYRGNVKPLHLNISQLPRYRHNRR